MNDGPYTLLYNGRFFYIYHNSERNHLAATACVRSLRTAVLNATKDASVCAAVCAWEVLVRRRRRANVQ